MSRLRVPAATGIESYCGTSAGRMSRPMRIKYIKMALQNNGKTTPGGSGAEVPQSHPDFSKSGCSQGFWGGAEKPLIGRGVYSSALSASAVGSNAIAENKNPRSPIPQYNSTTVTISDTHENNVAALRDCPVMYGDEEQFGKLNSEDIMQKVCNAAKIVMKVANSTGNFAKALKKAALIITAGVLELGNRLSIEQQKDIGDRDDNNTLLKRIIIASSRIKKLEAELLKYREAAAQNQKMETKTPCCKDFGKQELLHEFESIIGKKLSEFRQSSALITNPPPSSGPKIKEPPTPSANANSAAASAEKSQTKKKAKKKKTSVGTLPRPLPVNGPVAEAAAKKSKWKKKKLKKKTETPAVQTPLTSAMTENERCLRQLSELVKIAQANILPKTLKSTPQQKKLKKPENTFRVRIENLGWAVPGIMVKEALKLKTACPKSAIKLSNYNRDKNGLFFLSAELPEKFLNTLLRDGLLQVGDTSARVALAKESKNIQQPNLLESSYPVEDRYKIFYRCGHEAAPWKPLPKCPVCTPKNTDKSFARKPPSGTSIVGLSQSAGKKKEKDELFKTQTLQDSISDEIYYNF